MAQALHYGQYFSRRHISLGRELARMQQVGLLALICGSLGCWQEVRYEPVGSARPSQSVSAIESEQTTQKVPPAPAPEALFEDARSEAVVLAEEVSVGDPSAEANSPGGANLPGGDRTALGVWRMSCEWSMAAALYAKGRDVDGYGERLEQAKIEAKQLGVTLADLPIQELGADRLQVILAYLLEDAGPRLARDLQTLHGADHAALAELATKTHVLLLSYTPNSQGLEPVIAAVRQAAENSGLPKPVWRELVDLLTVRAEFKQVKAAIFQLHQRATASLSGRDN